MATVAPPLKGAIPATLAASALKGRVFKIEILDVTIIRM